MSAAKLLGAPMPLMSTDAVVAPLAIGANPALEVRPMAAVAAMAAVRARTNRGCGLWPVAAVAGGQERPRHGPHCLQNPGTSCQSISALVTNASYRPIGLRGLGTSHPKRAEQCSFDVEQLR